MHTGDSASVPSLYWALFIAGAGGLLVAMRELVAVFPDVGLLALLTRWRAWLYIAIGAVFSAGVVYLLRYLSDPQDRFAAVEQIAFAALGTSAAVRGSRHRLGAGRGADGSLSAVARVGALVDALLDALRKELRRQVTTRKAILVARGRGVDYSTARPVFYEHLGHAVENYRADDTSLDERREELNSQWDRLDQYVRKGAEAQARDALLYLALEMGGERFLVALLDLYDLTQDEPERAAGRLAALRRRLRDRKFRRVTAFLATPIPTATQPTSRAGNAPAGASAADATDDVAKPKPPDGPG